MVKNIQLDVYLHRQCTCMCSVQSAWPIYAAQSANYPGICLICKLCQPISFYNMKISNVWRRQSGILTIVVSQILKCQAAYLCHITISTSNKFMFHPKRFPAISSGNIFMVSSSYGVQRSGYYCTTVLDIDMTMMISLPDVQSVVSNPTRTITIIITGPRAY